MTNIKDNDIIVLHHEKGVGEVSSKQEEDILERYRNGSDIGYIVDKLKIPYEEVKKTIISFKTANRLKKSFTDEFKMLIAERDSNGISRRQIASELEINANTVKKACELFGQANKERATSESEFTKIELDKFDLKTCPVCKSSKVNLVDENTTYCKSCGDECIHHKVFKSVETIKEDGTKDIRKELASVYALRVNWEYVE